jgi:hypothetical protein
LIENCWIVGQAAESAKAVLPWVVCVWAWQARGRNFDGQSYNFEHIALVERVVLVGLEYRLPQVVLVMRLPGIVLLPHSDMGGASGVPN